jgi:hypothetical protein
MPTNNKMSIFIAFLFVREVLVIQEIEAKSAIADLLCYYESLHFLFSSLKIFILTVNIGHFVLVSDNCSVQ